MCKPQEREPADGRGNDVPRSSTRARRMGRRPWWALAFVLAGCTAAVVPNPPDSLIQTVPDRAARAPAATEEPLVEPHLTETTAPPLPPSLSPEVQAPEPDLHADRAPPPSLPTAEEAPEVVLPEPEAQGVASADLPESPSDMSFEPLREPLAGDSQEPVDEEPEQLTEEQLEPRPSIPVPVRPEVSQVVREFTGLRRHSFSQAIRRAGRYLPMIRDILDERGLPAELAYLPLVESHFRPNARSHAGAVGLWQFLDSTARLSGLRVDWWVDERLDPEAATHAAARHLQELYDGFGDWELALAAYNAGPGAVRQALRRTGGGGFWDLYDARALRSETCRYVPKFHAAVAVALAPETFGIGMGPGDNPLDYETVWVDSPVDLPTVARISGATFGELRRLNPALRRGCTPPGEERYPLRVPPGTEEEVSQGLRTIPPAERTTFVRYAVRPGDTLWGIARRYDTRSRAIAQLNRVRSARLLRPGQELVVPVRSGVPRAKTGLKSERVISDTVHDPSVHVVRKGDTLWGIGREHGVSAAEIQSWNRLGRGAVIRPGDRLAVAPQIETSQHAVAPARVHVVQLGETLWGISRRYGIPLGDLRKHNDLGPDAVLRPGDRLVVGPAKGDPT